MTGTFDNWEKTEKLNKLGDHFEKNVTLRSADERYYYKVCLLLIIVQMPRFPLGQR